MYYSQVSQTPGFEVESLSPHKEHKNPPLPPHGPHSSVIVNYMCFPELTETVSISLPLPTMLFLTVDGKVSGSHNLVKTYESRGLSCTNLLNCEGEKKWAWSLAEVTSPKSIGRMCHLIGEEWTCMLFTVMPSFQGAQSQTLRNTEGTCPPTIMGMFLGLLCHLQQPQPHEGTEKWPRG